KKGQTPLDVLECLQKGLDTLTAENKKQQTTINTQQGQIAELKQDNKRLGKLHLGDYGEIWSAHDIVADTWCAYLTKFTSNSHAVKIGSGPGTEEGKWGTEICNNVAIAAGASSGKCIQGYTRIGLTQKGPWASYYWQNGCSSGHRVGNGMTYVCCIW
ncbi:hypothetical protein THIOM_002399, partial [Candidatus Thiomargarita nelsonii]